MSGKLDVSQQDVNEKIKANLGLVYKMLNKFYLRDDPDAESAAYWALYKAVTSFDGEKNIAFSTYAMSCIYNALGDHLRHLKRQRQIEEISYNQPIYSDEHREHEMSEFIPAEATTEDLVLFTELNDEIQLAIKMILNDTSPKARNVIDVWLANEMQIQTTELAKACNVSQCYASQSLAVFKHKLKVEMEDYLHE